MMANRQEREDEVKLPERQERRVAFLGKCQVIPPTYFLPEDPVDNYFARKEEHLIGKKTSRLHFPFRSHHRSGRRWSNASPDLGRSKSRNSISHDSSRSSYSAHHSRSHSVPIRAPSPTLHISRDGTANRLRQKLVSPPPPSPLGRAVEEENGEIVTEPSSPSTPISPKANPLPLARPVAVRKPLTFGFDKDDEQEGQLGIDQITQKLSLRIPPIIYVHSISNKAIPADNPAAAVLNWEETEEKGSSKSSSEEEEKDYVNVEEEVFEEEDLHGECNCPDCETKMLAALAPNYTPNWTRSARRKYLADRKEAMNEQSRKSIKPPIWLKSEESELADTSSKLRDIQADEVDAKHGELQKEIIDKKADLDDHSLKPSITPEESTEDTILQKEVDQEVRLREEENRAKRTRNEMKRLSSDVGSGLRIGGGGARAMMRQLEEAEQAERRAKIERARSPKSPDEVPNNGKLEIPSPGIESPTVTPNNLTVQVEKPSRTPSPLKRMFSNGSTPGRKASPSDPAPLRYPSPSLLINRELALGIPVQSISSNNSSQSRQIWSSTSSVIVENNKSSMARQEETMTQRSKLAKAEMVNGNRRPSYDGRSSTDKRPSSSGLRRANTTGSRTHSLIAPPITIPPPVSGHPAHSQMPSSPNNVVDKARTKARNSFKDLVARIKN